MKKIILAAFVIFSLSACSKSVSIKVDKISFDSAQEYIAVGDTLSLTAHVTPVYAANQEIAWSSSNGDVAKVEDGKVIAVSSGSAVITASVSGCSIKADCNVTVGDIYLSGYDIKGRTLSLTDELLALWKNDKETILVAKDNILVYSCPVAVSNGSAYVPLALYDLSARDMYVLLWNDGEKVVYEDGDNISDVHCNDIFVLDGNVYLAGEIYDTDKGRYVAVQWKNGVMTRLTDGILNAYANSVMVSGSDVYVGGQRKFSKTSKDVATIWKNGVCSDLTESTCYGNVNDISVSGSDVYAAGSIKENDSSPYKATVWKNGVPSYLNTDNYNGEAYLVCVDGDDVFVFGDYSSGGNGKCAVWKNGVKLDLPVKYCKSMCLFGDILYVTGYNSNGANSYVSYLFEIDTKSFRITKTKDYSGVIIEGVTVR